MYIGDIFIPYVSEFSANKTTKDSKETNFISGDADLDETAPKLKELTISGVAAAHGSKTSDDYANDLEAALIRNSAYNIVEYNNKKGYFVLNDVDIPDTVENQNAREFSGTGKFLPSARYECVYRVETDYIESDLAIQFPPIIALPTGATNVRIKSPWEIMFIDEWHGTVGKDGKISIFKPFPIFDADNYVTATSTGDKTYMESAYGCFVTVIDAQDEKTEWTTTVGTDLPKGRYKIVFRLQDLNVTDDIGVIVTGSVSGELINETFTTGDTYWVTIETSEFEVITYETLTVDIKKLTATANTIEVNYGFILPTYTAKVVFENDTEVDCGNVKVFDSNGSTIESDWKQVFNYNHDFSTGIIIQNSFFRWHVDTNEIWDNTGELTNLINNQVGRLYPRAFKNNDVSYIVKEIRPDLVEIEFSLFDGESDASAEDCREIVLARFTPLYVAFELIRNGTFKWDWHVDFSTMPSWKAINAPTDLMVTSSLANIEYTSENGIFTVIFDECIVGICKSKNSSALVLGEGGMYVNNTAESGNFMFTLFMISGSLGSEYIFQNTSDATLLNVQSNRIFDNFADDSSAEYVVENGSGFTETYAYNTTGLRIQSNSDKLITKKLKNLKLGTGNYQTKISILSTKSVVREGGLIIASDPIYNNTYYVCCLEIDATQPNGGNLSRIKLLKFNQNQDIHGSYGVDGYGMYGYGAIKEEVVAVVANVNAVVGSKYIIECDYINEERSFEIYFYQENETKPETPLITYVGDEAFDYGNVGLFTRASDIGTGNIDVVFWSWKVSDSMIYDNVGYPFTVITGPSHGGVTGWQTIFIFNKKIGQDIDIGRYNLIVQTISTSNLGTLTFGFRNITKGNTTLALDTTSSTRTIGGDAVLTTYNQIIEFKESDIGDVAHIFVQRNVTGYYPLTLITYAALIPISNTEGSEIITPTNLSFASFNEQNYYRNLEPKEFGSNLLNRKYKSYR